MFLGAKPKTLKFCLTCCAKKMNKNPKFLPDMLRRSGAQWDKQHGVHVERDRLLAFTRDAVAKGLMSGNFWHTATNAEHARPMLQVP
jgi:hypothetical protein